MVFTSPEAWLGGCYDTGFFFDPSSSPKRILESIWSFPKVDGPYRSNRVEPNEQHRADLLDEDARFGVLTLADGGRVACATCVFREPGELEVTFAIYVGSLGNAWPIVGAFPFVTHDEALVWEPNLETTLVELANHVHQHTPFRRALVGFEEIGFHDELRKPGPVPLERGVGIFDVNGARLAWHPPTIRGG